MSRKSFARLVLLLALFCLFGLTGLFGPYAEATFCTSCQSSCRQQYHQCLLLGGVGCEDQFYACLDGCPCQ